MEKSKAAALTCLANHNSNVTDMVKYLLKCGRNAKKVLEFGGDNYEYHVIGLSVNFELWCSVNKEHAVEIGFISDH
jgi:hypothetical protein